MSLHLPKIVCAKLTCHFSYHLAMEGFSDVTKSASLDGSIGSEMPEVKSLDDDMQKMIMLVRRMSNFNLSNV
jgi:hypothetical protein